MGPRVKTDDPEFERACALSDALDEARQPLHPALRLGDLIDALEGVAPDTLVQFDFGGFEPTGVASYRGYYSDLAIGFAEDGLKAGELLKILKEAEGAVFTGYKGGDFRMDRQTPMWVDNWGKYNGVAVVAVEDQEYRVILRTSMIE